MFNCILPSLKRYVVVLNVACWNLYVVILHVDFTIAMFVASSLTLLHNCCGVGEV